MLPLALLLRHSVYFMGNVYQDVQSSYRERTVFLIVWLLGDQWCKCGETVCGHTRRNPTLSPSLVNTETQHFFSPKLPGNKRQQICREVDAAIWPPSSPRGRPAECKLGETRANCGGREGRYGRSPRTGLPPTCWFNEAITLYSKQLIDNICTTQIKM